jgi:AraC-like DNA-binding protein
MIVDVKMMTAGSIKAEPKAGPTVGAGYARGLLNLAVSKGADRDLLLARAEIDPEVLEDQDERVPMAKYVALMRAAKALTGDPALALHYGEAMDLSELSIVGLIARASDNMVEAFAQINRYGRLVIEVEGIGFEDRFQMRKDAQGLWLVDTRKNPNDFPELTESTFARMISGTREFGDGSRPFVKAIRVTHARPAHAAEYDRVLQAPVTFDSHENAMQVDEVWQDFKVARASRYVFGILSEHAERLLKDLASAKTVRGRVECMAIPMLHTGDLSIDLIASKMALSRQTLYRKLKAEGVTFEGVLDDLRHRMARHYLNGQKVSVNETAYLVGFSDPSAFSRAFKRWTGSSPRKRPAQAS